jgi:hypothetical protein
MFSRWIETGDPTDWKPSTYTRPNTAWDRCLSPRQRRSPDLEEPIAPPSSRRSSPSGRSSAVRRPSESLRHRMRYSASNRLILAIAGEVDNDRTCHVRRNRPHVDLGLGHWRPNCSRRKLWKRPRGARKGIRSKSKTALLLGCKQVKKLIRYDLQLDKFEWEGDHAFRPASKGCFALCATLTTLLG